MRVQKCFHIHLSLADTRNELANIHSYRRYLDGVTRASLTPDGVGEIEFEAGNGFNASLELQEIPCDSPDTVLFGSRGGDMELAGVIEFFPIKANLTEVALTLDYTIHSRLYAAMDFLTSFMDRFVNRQISVIQAHFQGVPVPARREKPAQIAGTQLEYAPVRGS